MAEHPRQIGPYEIVRELGRGAMGVVYHARHAALGHEVALKVIAAPADRTDLLARFQREARAAAQLAGHPGIVGVTDMGADERPDGAPLAWFAMDLVRGESLDAVIAGGELDVRAAAALVAQAARAAHHAHGQGLVHRDLKPANIVVEDGCARVTDFGLVSLQDVHGDLTRITTSDLLVGTPAYMAPEQVMGGRAPDPRVDVWSLGATLYECLVGHPPFRGESIYSVLSKLLHEEPPPIRPLHPGVPPAIEAIVMRALQKDPALRYASAEALADDLEAWLAGRPVRAGAPSGVTRLGLAARRHRGVALGAAGAVAAAALVAGIWWLLAQTDASRSGALATTHEAAREGDRAYRAAQAWRELSQQTLPAMQRLEDHWNVAPSTPEGVAADLAAVRGAAAEVQARHPDAKAPAAWVAAAEAYAARDGEFAALRALVDAAGDDPFPALLLARLNLTLWAWDSEMPAVNHGPYEMWLVEMPETAAQARRRELAAALLDRLTGGRALLRAADVEADLALLRAASLLRRDRSEAVAEAAAVARGLLDHPELSGVAARLYGHARFLEGDLAGAADAWEALVARRGWVAEVSKVAHARLLLAGRALQQDDRDAARALYARVRESTGTWLARHPDDADVLVRRAHALWGLVKIEGTEADPIALIDAARADLRRATEVEPDHPTAWRDRVFLESLAAETDRAWGREPIQRLRAAHALAGQWLARPVAPEARAEALEHRGVAGVAWARWLLERGEPMDAVYEAAMADLAEARALLPHDPDVLGSVGHGHSLAGDRAMTRGESPREALARALACQREACAATAAPRAAHRHALAEALATYGEFCSRWGEDAAPYLAEALALATALEADVGVPDMAELTGTILVYQAEVEVASHRDPTPACRGALEAFARARALRRGRLSAAASRRQANALYLRGRWEQGQGVDPSLSFTAALEAYAPAIALAGLDAAAQADRALVHLALGEWADATGDDPQPHYRAALTDQDAVVAALPANATALHSRGVTHRALAQAQYARGEDPTVALGRARDDLNLALKLDATSPDRLNDRGLLFRTWAEMELAAGQGASLRLELALQDFDRALELAPDHLAALNNRGNTWSSVAKAQRWRDEDPRPALRRGLADFDRLVAAAPDDADGWSNRGLLHQEMGNAERGWGDGDPDAHYALAVADFDAALARNPRSVAAYSNRGTLHVSRGEAARAAGRDPRPHYRAAVRDHTAALALAPGDAGALVNRAAARSALASAEAEVGNPEAEAERTAGLADADAALAASPRLWQGHALRGRLLADLGRRDEALAAYDRALVLHPGHPTLLAWRQELVEGKRR